MDTDTGGYLKSLFGLEGKRALVTGASSGLGAASAAALAAAGAGVVVSGRDAERTQAVADAVGGSAEVADLLEPVRRSSWHRAPWTAGRSISWSTPPGSSSATPASRPPRSRGIACCS